MTEIERLEEEVAVSKHDLVLLKESFDRLFSKWRDAEDELEGLKVPGKGRIVCPYCNGTGWAIGDDVPVATYPCAECYGRGFFDLKNIHRLILLEGKVSNLRWALDTIEDLAAAEISRLGLGSNSVWGKVSEIALDALRLSPLTLAARKEYQTGKTI